VGTKVKTGGKGYEPWLPKQRGLPSGGVVRGVEGGWEGGGVEGSAVQGPRRAACSRPDSG
jgi:hypothetical protein